MIGVLSRPDQRPVVEEFFQLFKTPWEFYAPDRPYDVVIATTDGIPAVDARLLLIAGPDVKSSDAEHGFVPRGRRQGASLTGCGTPLPLHGDVLTFQTGGPGIAVDSERPSLMVHRADSTVIRLGYDLFDEVRVLLSVGQSVQDAHVPTLDLHAAMLREWILNAGIPLVEIPPVPAGHRFAACLTHDIDFAGIRHHRFDHAMWGFLYRSTVGALYNVLRGRLSLPRLLKMWRAAASLPFVYLGWARDFWDPFPWYVRAEKHLPATYFVIPFKGRAGARVVAPHAARRAAAYDVTDVAHWTAALVAEGCEVGVHGIDAWHSVDQARQELARIAAVASQPAIGVRIHWLLRDASTFRVLEDAGYAWDSSVGYNETIGYRSGTTQVFRPLGAQSLLELPLHIQDGALFYPSRLDLSEPDAWVRCGELVDNATRLGGVLTILWHDRSHAPERCWGDFYLRLVHRLRALPVWFATAGQVVAWYRQRRAVRFIRVDSGDGRMRTLLHARAGRVSPPLTIRVHQARDGAYGGHAGRRAVSTFRDIPWDGEGPVALDALLGAAPECVAAPSGWEP